MTRQKPDARKDCADRLSKPQKKKNEDEKEEEKTALKSFFVINQIRNPARVGIAVLPSVCLSAVQFVPSCRREELTLRGVLLANDHGKYLIGQE